MSSATVSFDPNTTQIQPPPAHHVHRSSDRLPARPDEQSILNTDGGSVFDSNSDLKGNPSSTMATPGSESGYKSPIDDSIGITNPNDSRKSETHTTFQDPVKHHSDPKHGDPGGNNLSSANEGKAKVKFTDKVIGKVEQVSGSMTKNTNLQEKGELRQAVGKAGAEQAGVPHS